MLSHVRAREILSLGLAFLLAWNAVPAQAGPGATSQQRQDEESIRFPSGDILFVRKSATGWDVGINDKNNHRSLLASESEIRWMTQFAEGPSAALRAWVKTPVTDASTTSIGITSWFAYGSDSSVNVIQRTTLPSSPFVLMKFPFVIPSLKRVSAASFIVGKSTFFLYAFEGADGIGKTIVVDATSTTFRVVADRYIRLIENGNKLCSIQNGALSFSKDALKVDLTDLKNNVRLHVFTMQSEGASSTAAGNISAMTNRAAAILNGFTSSASPQQSPAAAPQALTQGLSPVSVPQKQKGAMSLPYEIDYAGRAYILFSEKSGQNTGTFLRRSSDGKTVKVSPIVITTNDLTKSGIVVEDGIVSVGELPRQIDLDHFDAETRFNPTLTDGDLSWLTQTFEDGRSTSRRRINPVKSRHDLVKQVLARMTSSTGSKAAPVLYGEAGDIENIIMKAIDQLPRTWRIPVMDSGTVGTDIGTVGDLEKKVKMMDKVSQTVPTVWLAPDFENLAGIGATRESPKDFLSMVRPMVKNGTMRIAGVAGNDLFDKVRDPQIQQSLSTIGVVELAKAEVVEALKEWVKSNPSYPMASDEFLSYVMDTAQAFNPAAGEPERSVNLLEDIYSFLDSEGNLTVEHLTIKEVDRSAQRVHQMDPATRDLNLQRMRLKNLVPEFRKSIIGHDQIIQNIYEYTKSCLAGLGNRRGPCSSFWIDGPPGTGKTELAIVLARVRGLPVVKIEMSQFDGVALGKNELMGQIGSALKKNPFTVIILDEIEKANPKVLEALLSMMDNERFTYYEDLGGDRKKPVRGSAVNATFVMTSNSLGDQVAALFRSMLEEEKKKGQNLKDIKFSGKHLMERFLQEYSYDEMIDMIVARGIPKPLLDRVKSKNIGFPPTFEGLKRILELKLNSAQKSNAKQMDITLHYENSDLWLQEIAERSMNEGWSSRTTIEAVEAELNSRASDLIMSESFTVKTPYRIDLKKPRPICSWLAEP